MSKGWTAFIDERDGSKIPEAFLVSKQPFPLRRWWPSFAWGGWQSQLASGKALCLWSSLGSNPAGDNRHNQTIYRVFRYLGYSNSRRLHGCKIMAVHTWQGNTFKSMLSNQVNFVLLGSSAHGFMTIQVGPFSALEHVTDTLIFLAQILQVFCFASKWSVHLHSPDHAPLLWHFWMLGGSASQEAGGTSSFCTADADKIPGSHDFTRRLSRHLVGNHRVLADFLQDLQQDVVQNLKLRLDSHVCPSKIRLENISVF